MTTNNNSFQYYLIQNGDAIVSDYIFYYKIAKIDDFNWIQIDNRQRTRHLYCSLKQLITECLKYRDVFKLVPHNTITEILYEKHFE